MVDVLVAVEVPHVAFGSFEKLFHIFSVSVWNARIGYIADWRERFASLFAVLKVSGYNSIEFRDDVLSYWPYYLVLWNWVWIVLIAAGVLAMPPPDALCLRSRHLVRSLCDRGIGNEGPRPLLASPPPHGQADQCKKFTITAKVVKPKSFSYQEKGGKGVKDNGWSKIKWRVRLFFIMLYKKKFLHTFCTSDVRLVQRWMWRV